VPIGREAYIGDAPELTGDDDHNPPRLVNRMHLARTRKTPYELDCMRVASKVAARAHAAALAGFRDGGSEFQIHQRYLDAAQLSDAQLPYASIVALNRHAAVLHYQQRDRAVPAQMHSFLIDAGATVHGYAADVTRTYAAGEGEFAALIEALDALQLDLCAQVRAGLDYRELHLAAHLSIAGLLSDTGIIKVTPEQAVDSGLSGVFFPHGLGHYIGLQTHDVAGLIADEDGTPIPRPHGHPFLRLTRVLEAGNVLTIEPGIYFIDTLLEKWRRRHGDAAIDWARVDALRPCGGIRIEDNVVVTADDPENLTRVAFDA
jgi:Xaa-Pro dipeptidase